VLDGRLARRAKWTTRLGALDRPHCRPHFALVAVITFLDSGSVASRQLVLMLSRDIMTAIGFIVVRVVSWFRPVHLRATRRQAGDRAAVHRLRGPPCSRRSESCPSCGWSG
jgi:phosphatidylglycerophosphate synthase